MYSWQGKANDSPDLNHEVRSWNQISCLPYSRSVRWCLFFGSFNEWKEVFFKYILECADQFLDCLPHWRFYNESLNDDERAKICPVPDIEKSEWIEFQGQYNIVDGFHRKAVRSSVSMKLIIFCVHTELSCRPLLLCLKWTGTIFRRKCLLRFFTQICQLMQDLVSVNGLMPLATSLFLYLFGIMFSRSTDCAACGELFPFLPKKCAMWF